MSESRERKRRQDIRQKFVTEFDKWLDREPPMILFWKWHKWKKERPDWKKFRKKEFETNEPWDWYWG